MSMPQRFGTWFEILLEQLSHREVTYRADIVFAACNLMQMITPIAERRSSLIQAMGLDYGNLPAVNYAILTGKLISLTDGLGMLSLVDHSGESPSHEKSTASLPSWVPDINKPLSSSVLLAQDFDAPSSLGAGDPMTMGNFGRTTSIDPALRSKTISGKRAHLALKGVILGPIADISPLTAAADTESWYKVLSSIQEPDWSAQ
jgi:hypothetical protein